MAAPAFDQKTPERVPASDPAAKPLQHARDLDGAYELPDVDIAGLAQHLGEQLIAPRTVGGRERLVKLADRHVLVPQEIGAESSDFAMSVVSARIAIPPRPDRREEERQVVGKIVREGGLEPYRRNPRSSTISRSCSDHAGLRGSPVPPSPGCSRLSPPRVAATWQQKSASVTAENGLQFRSRSCLSRRAFAAEDLDPSMCRQSCQGFQALHFRQ
jgi:hypothetical protein